MNEEKYIHQQMKGKQPFKVPEGYFDDLAMRIMTNLPDAEQHGETPTVAVNKHRTVRLWTSAAAACLAVMVVATALLFQQDSPQHVYKVQATEMSGDRFVDEAADYAMIDNTDIYAYLEDN